MTDAEGRFKFITIKPGAYPWGNHENAWRPQHIHFSVFGRAFTQRLVTQMYFPGDPLLALDPIYKSAPAGARDDAGRAALDDLPLDPGRAAIHLGWKPWTSLEEGLGLTVEALRARFDVPISVDTWRASVLDEACRAGACVGNDISGFGDPDYLPWFYGANPRGHAIDENVAFRPFATWLPGAPTVQ